MSIVVLPSTKEANIKISSNERISSLKLVIVDGINFNETYLNETIHGDFNIVNVQVSLTKLLINSSSKAFNFYLDLKVNLPFRYHFYAKTERGDLVAEEFGELIFIDEPTVSLLSKILKEDIDELLINKLSTELEFQRFTTNLKCNFFNLTLLQRDIYVSGCGNGSECYALKKLGAKSVLGMDVSEIRVSLASHRFRDVPGVAFTTKFDDVKSDFFDIAISRHVVEHVSQSSIDRAKYLEELCSTVKIGGYVYIEVPNSSSVYEQHTDTLFFSLLDQITKEAVIESIEAGVASRLITSELKSKLKGILHHRNVSYEEIIEGVPSSFRKIDFCFRDSFNQISQNDRAPTMQFLFQRVI